MTRQAWYYGILNARHKRTGVAMEGIEIGNFTYLGSASAFVDYLQRWIHSS